MCEQWQLYSTSQWEQWTLLSEHVYCVVTFKMTKRVEQQIFIKFCIKVEHSSTETIWMIQKLFWMIWMMPQPWATGDWQLHHDNVPTHASCFMQSILAKYQITQVAQPLYSPDLVPCNFWLFPNLELPFKGKRFHILYEDHENMTGQLMVIGRAVWGPKVPALKGTEVSLSHVRCFF